MSPPDMNAAPSASLGDLRQRLRSYGSRERAEAAGPAAARGAANIHHNSERPIREIDILELWRMARRGKAVLVGTIIAITALAGLVSFDMAPLFTARALVMLEPREMKVMKFEDVVSSLPSDVAAIESEMEVLRSPALAASVIKDLNLENDPEFNAGRVKATGIKGFVATVKGKAADWIISFGSPAAGAPPSAASKEARRRSSIIETFLGRLRVAQQGRSRVISVQYSAGDPEKAARIANALTGHYVAQQIEAKFAFTRRANDWLEKRVVELRVKVEESENAVEAYRKRTGLVEGKGTTIASQQLAEINTQLILAQTRRSEAEARLRNLDRLMREHGDIESVAAVLASPLIQRLREHETQALRKVTELSNDYGERHPRIIRARAELKNIRAKIKIEVDRIAKNYRNEVEVARARENALRAGVRRVQTDAAGLNEADIHLRALERESAANQALLETFLARFKETSTQEDVQRPDAMIISRAEVPVWPSSLKRSTVLGVALIASIILGVILVFAIEVSDAGFRSIEQIEQRLDMASLGLVPMIEKRFGRRPSPADYVIANPESPFTDAIGNITTGLQLLNVFHPPKVLLVASAVQNEGKTSFAVAMARHEAFSGKNVLIIDCDLRRPSVHQALGMANQHGLAELLSGDDEFDGVRVVDPASGLHIITAGESLPNATELLRSAEMHSLLDEARKHYDLVILDSPAVQAVSYARVLSRMVDKTVFLVRWGSTRREAAAGAVRQMQNVGADFAGVVMSQVDVKKLARYAYGESGYYYGRNQKYYYTRAKKSC